MINTMPTLTDRLRMLSKAHRTRVDKAVNMAAKQKAVAEAAAKAAGSSASGTGEPSPKP